MAQVVVKLDSILLHERNTTDSVDDEVNFINRLINLFTDKAELMKVAEGGSKNEICAEHVQKSKDKRLRVFKYTELVSATNNFTRKLTDETTYEAWMDGYTCAPTKYSTVGLDMYVRKKHIRRTSKLHLKAKEFNHPIPNLVKLVGYCLKEQQLYCVYELNTNPSLETRLFNQRVETSLCWIARLKIALGAAQGLSFLHQRNQPAYVQFKTSLILVDSENNATLCDYEVENSFVALDSYSLLYTSSEYYRYLTQKETEWKDGLGIESEIYSFGVVLLEILTGLQGYDVNRPHEKKDLVHWARPLLSDRENLKMIMDPQLLGDDHHPKGAFKMALLISKCIQRDQEQRPSMEEILQVLHECYFEETNTVDS